MSFQFLAPELHKTALAAKRYFSQEHGARNFKIESPVRKDLSLRPTLQAQLSDKSILCIEVSGSAYSNTLDTFVVGCLTQGLPVKLYVVIPSADGDRSFGANIKQARSAGVGIVEVSDGPATPICPAVPLSLLGLRKVDLKNFPKARRDKIRQAQETFLNGNPAKGCLGLYEELEALTRTFAVKSKALGWWRKPHTGERGPSGDPAKGPWAKRLKELATFLSLRSCRKKCPNMSDALIARARGVSDPRNLTAHKPTSLKIATQRDEKRRTWFESAADLLKDWYDATKPLKL